MLSRRIPRGEIVHMLSALGEAKALEVVNRAATRMQQSSDNYDSQIALQMLEIIASEPGLVGIAARFAKARALLKWSSGPTPKAA